MSRRQIGARLIYNTYIADEVATHPIDIISPSEKGTIKVRENIDLQVMIHLIVLNARFSVIYIMYNKL